MVQTFPNVQAAAHYPMDIEKCVHHGPEHIIPLNFGTWVKDWGQMSRWFPNTGI